MPGYKFNYDASVESRMLCIMKESKDLITYKRAQAVYLRFQEFSPKEYQKY